MQKIYVPQKQIHFGYVKLHIVSIATHHMILKNGGVSAQLLISQQQFIIEH